MKRKLISESNIMICGIVRDCEKTILNDLNKLDEATKNFKNKIYYIVESDSKDNTIHKLENCKSQFDNFNYISLGTLKKRFESRTERLAYCRNMYLNYLDNFNETNIDYVIVSDLDDMNRLLNIEAIESCWNTEIDWDVITANQLYKYYDIYALRHKYLNPFNQTEALSLMENFFEKKELIKFFIENKFFSISAKSKLIKVDSAFGGLAIYKKQTLENVRYHGIRNNYDVCEHVELNLQIVKNNYKIYINPKLINTDYTLHTPRISILRYFIGFNIMQKIKKYFKL